MSLYRCDRLSMRVKIKRNACRNIHRISGEKHSCSISFWGSFTSLFSRNIIDIIHICIHINVPGFISFAYENHQNRQVFGGPAAEGGGPYEDLILLFPFTFLKTARQAFFGEGAAGFMRLRPLPPAPLMAKWLCG